MRVLENNNKPATHFIEVWRNPQSNYVDDWNYPLSSNSIEYLNSSIDESIKLNFITIAIFKIRAK